MAGGTRASKASVAASRGRLFIVQHDGTKANAFSGFTPRFPGVTAEEVVVDFTIHRRAWTFTRNVQQSSHGPCERPVNQVFGSKVRSQARITPKPTLVGSGVRKASPREVISSLVGVNPPADLVRLITVLLESIHAQAFDVFADGRILSVPVPAWRRTVVAA